MPEGFKKASPSDLKLRREIDADAMVTARLKRAVNLVQEARVLDEHMYGPVIAETMRQLKIEESQLHKEQRKWLRVFS